MRSRASGASDDASAFVAPVDLQQQRPGPVGSVDVAVPLAGRLEHGIAAPHGVRGATNPLAERPAQNDRDIRHRVRMPAKSSGRRMRRNHEAHVGEIATRVDSAASRRRRPPNVQVDASGVQDTSRWADLVCGACLPFDLATSH